MSVKMNDEILVYDLETYTPGSRPDPEKDEHRLFGCYSYKTKKFYFLTRTDDIQKVIDAHKYLIGYNNLEYDNPILIRAGIKNMEYKINIDMLKIFKKRAGVIQIKKGLLKDLLMSYSLDFITRTLDLVDDSTAKKKIDYSVFKKPHWTPEEMKEIADYNRRDIEVSMKMYEFLEDYFKMFKDYVTEEDVRKKKYLTDAISVFTYKLLCRKLNLEPEFTDVKDDEESEYLGGYVAYPAGERFEDNILYEDFSSLYPSLFIQGNLYSGKCDCCTQEEKWHGDGFFNVEGYYCSKQQGKIEKLFKELFMLRKQYKKEKNRAEYCLKIALNTSYGIAGSPKFKQLANKIAASDCTSLGRQCIKYMRKKFRENGFLNLMSDTDSCVVQIPNGKTKEDAANIVKEGCEELKKHFPFPWEEFGMKLEDEIKYFFFFKGKIDEELDEEMDEEDYINKPKGFMKKNYCYVSNDGHLVIKNLGIKKKSNSPLSRKIFNDYLVPEIIKTGQVKFSKTFIRNLIIKLLDEDITLAAMRKDVGELKDYEKSPTGIHAQISKKYGPGIHFLIPNTRGLGVGIGKKFCTTEEFKEHKLGTEHVDLSNVEQELGYFMKEAPTKNIFEY